MVLTEMINLAAEIAEQLLVAKDNDSDGLLPKTKLDIIRLAELAATMPDLPEAPSLVEDCPDTAPEEPEAEPDPLEEPEPLDEPEPRTATETGAHGTPEREGAPGLVAAQLRRIFSLNDLFLFRRELFQGSQVLFDRALEDVGTCSSAPQARELLIDRYAIDPKRPEAKEFLNVIGSLFEI